MITQEQLIEKVPEAFRPLAQEYGPAFIKMGEAEVLAWINMLAKGETEEAYKKLLANMDNKELLQEGGALDASWSTANAANAEKIAVMKRARNSLMGVLLTLALAAVGL